MSHLLPPASHPARAMFDVADLVAIGTGATRPIFMDQAKRAARATFAANPSGLIRRLFYIVMRSDTDVLELISVGPRGGHRREWTFGPYRTPMNRTSVAA